MQSKQQLDKHLGDRQMPAPPSPTMCPTVLRAGPASPSRTQATSLPPHTAAQPLPLPGLLHAAQLRQPLERESPRPCTGVTRAHTHACTHTAPLLQVLKLPLVVEKPAPKPRPASQDPGLSVHLPTLSSTGPVFTLTCEPVPTPRSTPGRQVETAQDRAKRSSPCHISDAKPAFKHRRVQSNDPYSEGGFCH